MNNLSQMLYKADKAASRHTSAFSSGTRHMPKANDGVSCLGVGSGIAEICQSSWPRLTVYGPLRLQYLCNCRQEKGRRSYFYSAFDHNHEGNPPYLCMMENSSCLIRR